MTRTDPKYAALLTALSLISAHTWERNKLLITETSAAVRVVRCLFQRAPRVLCAASIATVQWRVVAFSIPAPVREWNDYTASHVGRWNGLWTTYDRKGIQIGEPDRMDTSIELSSDGDTVRQTNILHVGSIDSECSSCFDSVETRRMPAGEFTRDNFRQRACGEVYLSGPGVTRRGDLTTEICFRNANRRMRCIVSYTPRFDGAEVPSQLALDRVVLVREILSSRDGGNPRLEDFLFQIDGPSWLGLWHGNGMVLDTQDTTDVGMTWRPENVPSTRLSKRQSPEAPEEQSHVLLEFDGGIRLEAPNLISAGKDAELSVCLATDHSESNGPARITQAKIRFEALRKRHDTAVGVADNTPYVVLSPPALRSFSIKDLEPVESAKEE